MFIYVILNSENLKIYIGKTVKANLNKYLQEKLWRAQTNSYNGRSHLFAAMQKHLSAVWSIYPLFESASHDEICAHERLLIQTLGAQYPEVGYNICHGGRGVPGAHPKKGIPRPPEVVAKIKAARAIQDESPRIEGCRKYAEEHKEEMSTRLSHEAHVLGGKAGSREAKQRAARISVAGGSLVKAQHIRWHVNRGQTSPKCHLCRCSAD